MGQKSFWVKKVFGSKKFLGQKHPDPKLKTSWGHLSSTFHIGRPETLTDRESESVTDGRTDRLTWVGARDACASKKEHDDDKSKILQQLPQDVKRHAAIQCITMDRLDQEENTRKIPKIKVISLQSDGKSSIS